MIRNPFDAVPHAHRDAAWSALRAAFGPVPFDAITPVKGGASGASVFSVDAGGRRYLLRMEAAASPLRNPHQYQSMRIAAEAGIAPRIHYIDEDARVAVIDFIEAQPLAGFPGGPPALAQALGALLRRMQATPAFPRFVTYPDIVERLWAYVCRTGLFGPGLLDPYTERLAQIRESYVWDEHGSVSSHNDAIPSNILFDGARLWMIDWESAYRNDPLVDVAIMIDTMAATPELEAAFLLAWRGGVLDMASRYRLMSVRALTRLYYAGVLFSASVAAAWRRMPDTDLSALSLSQLQDSVRDGRLKPGAPDTRHALGKMYLASFFTGILPPGLSMAV